MAEDALLEENKLLRLENDYLRESKLKLIIATSKEIERLRQLIKALSKSLTKEGFSQREIDQIQTTTISVTNATKTSILDIVQHVRPFCAFFIRI